MRDANVYSTQQSTKKVDDELIRKYSLRVLNQTLYQVSLLDLENADKIPLKCRLILNEFAQIVKNALQRNAVELLCKNLRTH
jgi:hypothetical protein